MRAFIVPAIRGVEAQRGARVEELQHAASHFGIDRIVRKPPDVVMTVRDARKATEALARAPGRLTVLDNGGTIYFRPPAVFIEPEPLLMTLRNLLMKAYEAARGGGSASVAGASA